MESCYYSLVGIGLFHYTKNEGWHNWALNGRFTAQIHQFEKVARKNLAIN